MMERDDEWIEIKLPNWAQLKAWLRAVLRLPRGPRCC
jgi:hypothetical protein